jgi:hypothetical protein
VELGGVDLWLAGDLDNEVRPAGRNRGAAVAIGMRRQVAQHVSLKGHVQARAGDQLRELVPPVWVADLLESDHIGFQAPQLLVRQPRASGIALIMLHVDSQHPQVHRTPLRWDLERLGLASHNVDSSRLATSDGPNDVGPGR